MKSIPRQIREYAESAVPDDPLGPARAVANAIRVKRRRRQQRAGAVIVAATAIVAVAITTPQWLPTPDRSDKMMQIADPKPYTAQDVQDLTQRCQSRLSGPDVATITVTSIDKSVSATLTRDASQALLCTGFDASTSDEVVQPVKLNSFDVTNATEPDWTVVRSPDRLTYVAAITASGGKGPWLGGSDFTFKEGERTKNSGGLNLVLGQVAKPLNNDQYIVFGLTQNNGCECGSPAQISNDQFTETELQSPNRLPAAIWTSQGTSRVVAYKSGLKIIYDLRPDTTEDTIVVTTTFITEDPYRGPLLYVLPNPTDDTCVELTDTTNNITQAPGVPCGYAVRPKNFGPDRDLLLTTTATLDPFPDGDMRELLETWLEKITAETESALRSQGAGTVYRAQLTD